MLIALAVIGVIVVLVGVYVWGLYNRMVGLANLYTNAWVEIDIQLKRRYDLIPNLLETVKGYMAHEKDTLEAVISARGAAVGAAQRAAAAPGDPGAMKALSQAESGLGGALGRLMAVVESYPELKANQNTMALQSELAGTENTLAQSRSLYNMSVMEYNTARQMFPAVVFTGMLGFPDKAQLEATDSAKERKAPKVSFK
jgi:LemA protein